MPMFMELHTGPAVEDYIDAIATLRIDIFREYPYLYEGTRTAERQYLRHYAEAERACVITVADNGAIVGAATGIPLGKEARSLIEPFAGTIYSIDEIYYVGELLFYPAYRNQGLGMSLLSLLEEHVRSFGNYNYLTCATVVRSDVHPLRPAAYTPIDKFLAKAGFTALSCVTATFQWLEIDGCKHDHSMNFWFKDLTQ